MATTQKSAMSILKLQRRALKKQIRRETAKAKKLADMRAEVKNLSVKLDQARGDVHYQEQRFVCPRCEGEFGWCAGASDDTPALCDECANLVQGDGAGATEELLDDDGVWVDTGVPAPTATESALLRCAPVHKLRANRKIHGATSSTR